MIALQMSCGVRLTERRWKGNQVPRSTPLVPGYGSLAYMASFDSHTYSEVGIKQLYMEALGPGKNS